MPSEIERLADVIRMIGADTGPARPRVREARATARRLAQTATPGTAAQRSMSAALQQAAGRLGQAEAALDSFASGATSFADRLASRGGGRAAENAGGGGEPVDSRNASNSSQADFEAIFPELKGRSVNPSWPHPNFLQNCQACVVATDRTLVGQPHQAGSRPVDANDKPLPHPWFDRWPDNVIQATNGTPLKNVASIDEITREMASLPDGARGIVHGLRYKYLAGERVPAAGHVFNVVKRDGAVHYVDGQTGTYANLSGYTAFQFMRTGTG
jgi:hypothetical protein